MTFSVTTDWSGGWRRSRTPFVPVVDVLDSRVEIRVELHARGMWEPFDAAVGARVDEKR